MLRLRVCIPFALLCGGGMATIGVACTGSDPLLSSGTEQDSGGAIREATTKDAGSNAATEVSVINRSDDHGCFDIDRVSLVQR